jgi:hypothetical protein
MSGLECRNLNEQVSSSHFTLVIDPISETTSIFVRVLKCAPTVTLDNFSTWTSLFVKNTMILATKKQTKITIFSGVIVLGTSLDFT